MGKFIDTTQAGEILGLSHSSITRLINEGKLNALPLPNGYCRAGYKIKAGDVYALLQKRNAPKIEKWCPRCEQDKPLCEFGRNRSKKDKLRAYCRQCTNAVHREQRHHPENREKDRAYTAQYREDHPEKVKQSMRRWHQQHKDEQRVYHQSRRPQRRERYRNDPVHRAKVLASCHRRIALKRGALAAELIDRQTIIERDKATCYICEIGPLDDSEIHLDHVVPLSKGGDHVPGNLRVACVSCNLKKSDRSLAKVRELIAQDKW